VTETTHVASAMQHMSVSHQYAAIVVTDPRAMDKRSIALQRKLMEFAYSGGTVIFGFHCSSFVRPDDLARCFKEVWSVNWTHGDYTRSIFSLNSLANPIFMTRRGPNLPQQYSMKGVHLSGTKAEGRMYISSANSTQSSAVLRNMVTVI
jgi:hypothetical protein